MNKIVVTKQTSMGEKEKRKTLLRNGDQLLKYVLLSLFCFYSLHGYAQSKKRLYIGNDDHTDYMWSGDEAQYDSVFVKMLDFQLNKIDATKNNPPDFQARFNCDGSYWVETYAKYRSKAQFDRLIAAIRSGHISLPLTTLVNTYGAQSAESVIRGMFYAGRLERQYNLHLPLVNAMENNTLPLGLNSLWAGSGAKYSWKGVGGYGSQLSHESMANRKYQLYRSLGPDSSGVLMKWYGLGIKGLGAIGGYGECRFTLKKTDTTRDIEKSINSLDTLTTRKIYPYTIAAAFGYGHDDLSSFVADQFISAAKNTSNLTRSVRVSNEEDFFKDVEHTYPNLPGQSVSFGNEWDVLSASMNETTAKVKRATEQLRSAEALASIVSLKDPAFYLKLQAERYSAWDGFGMYYEHNWTGDGPVSQAKRAAWQIKLQKNISSYADTLQYLALKELGNQLKKGTRKRFYVFNALGWIRNDIADIAYSGPFPVKVIDLETKKLVPVQKLIINNKTYLRIYASAIPSVGYKVYEIEQGKPESSKDVANFAKGLIENHFYRIRLSRAGVLTSIYDKISKREIVRKINGRFLNDLGTKDIDKGSVIEIENSGPISVTYKVVSSDPVSHTTRLTLYRNDPKIEIQNTIDSNYKDVKTWSFSLNLKNTVVHHEELGAILTVRKKSAGGDYADQNARYDWQTFNHFADMSEDGYGITIANADCSFFKLGNSTVSNLSDTSNQINALAGGQVDRKVEDGGTLGIRNQNGQNLFHYQFAIMSHATPFNPVDAMKFSLQECDPMVTGWVTGDSGDSEPSFSLLSVKDPGVLLWGVKPAEDYTSRGLSVRLWNMNSTSISPQVSFFKPVVNCWQSTHVETDLHKVRLTKGIPEMRFHGKQIGTYKVQL